jgi:hypothetical protein
VKPWDNAITPAASLAASDDPGLWRRAIPIAWRTAVETVRVIIPLYQVLTLIFALV